MLRGDGMSNLLIFVVSWNKSFSLECLRLVDFPTGYYVARPARDGVV